MFLAIISVDERENDLIFLIDFKYPPLSRACNHSGAELSALMSTIISRIEVEIISIHNDPGFERVGINSDNV